MWKFKGKDQAWGRLGDCRGSSHVQLEKNSKVEITIQLNLQQQNVTKGLFRTELGDDLEIVLLEMTIEGQEERIRARHDGNQHAVEMMRVSIVCFSNDFVTFVSIVSFVCFRNNFVFLHTLRQSMTWWSQPIQTIQKRRL